MVGCQAHHAVVAGQHPSCHAMEDEFLVYGTPSVSKHITVRKLGPVSIQVEEKYQLFSTAAIYSYCPVAMEISSILEAL